MALASAVSKALYTLQGKYGSSGGDRASTVNRTCDACGPGQNVQPHATRHQILPEQSCYLPGCLLPKAAPCKKLQLNAQMQGGDIFIE
jgi:hypothetical protein